MQIKGEINMLMFIAAALGIILALSFDIYIPEAVSPYIAISLIAALDSILGGITASYDKKFNFMIFITGLLGNAAISATLIFIGKRLGIDIYLAAVVVFVMRIFKNFAIIRRHFVDKIQQKNCLKNGITIDDSVEND